MTKTEIIKKYSTEELVEMLVEKEYQRACKKYGNDYHSYHEASAVLFEEIEEVGYEINNIKNMYSCFWEKVKADVVDGMDEYIYEIYKIATRAIIELAQVGVVARKIENTIEKE